MADNVILDAMLGGDTIAADEISAVKYQRMKLIHGADGVNDGDVSTANPFPVDIREIGGAGLTLGQKTKANSIPVTFASDEAVVLEVHLAYENDDVTVYGSQGVSLQQKVTTNDLIMTLDGEAVVLGAGTAEIGNVKNAGTFAVQVDGSALTALQLIDNMAVAVDGNYLNVNMNIAGTDIVGGAGVVAAGVQRVTLASDDPAVASLGLLDNSVDGNYLNVNLNVAGTDVAANNGTASAQTLRVTVASDSTGQIKLAAGTNGIGKLTANSGVDIGDVDILSIVPGVAATNLGKAEDAVHATGDTGVFALSVANEAQSALAADGDYIGQATDTKGNSLTVGNVAHDAADAGYPVKIGHKAVAHGANPTAVAAGDRTDSYANRAGIPFVVGGHPNVITRSNLVTDADGAQTDYSMAGAIGAGTKIVITQIQVTADNANTGDVSVRIGFGAANVPAAALAGAAGIILAHPGIPSGGGVSRGDGSGIVAIGGDGEELRLTCEDPVGGNITVTYSYYTIES